MSTRRRLDLVAKRIAGWRVPDDPVDILTADRLAAMTDEQLEIELRRMLEVVKILDEAGALDDVLAAGGLTRDDLYIDIDPADPNPIATVRKVYEDYIDPAGTLPPKEHRR
jgi:hypothetical protein